VAYDVVNFSFVDKKSPNPIVKFLITNMKLLTTDMKSHTGNKKFLSHVLKFLIIKIMKLMILLITALKLPRVVSKLRTAAVILHVTLMKLPIVNLS
jgi:hypothetical protein